MRSSLTTTLAALMPSMINALASSPASSNSCVTVTATTGSTCTTFQPSHCIVPACIVVSTVTLSCGCPSIYTDTQCATACPTGCGVSYSTAYLPCAANSSMMLPPTTTPSVSLNGIMTTSSLSVASSSSVLMTLPPTTHIFPNTTMTTSQPQSSVSVTTPVVTSVVVVGPRSSSGSSTTASTASVTPSTNEGSRYGFGIVEGGVLVGLIGAVLGMM